MGIRKQFDYVEFQGGVKSGLASPTRIITTIRSADNIIHVP